MHKKFTALILDDAVAYIETMNEAGQGTAKADIDFMESGEFEAVKTKQLRGKVRELIFGNHRVTYFLLGNYIYFVRGFTKKTAKTPVKEIEYAEKIFEIVKRGKKNRGNKKRTTMRAKKHYKNRGNGVKEGELNLKWHTAGEVFKKTSSTKAFKQAYKAESARIRIAQALREARTEKRITQAALAKKTSMPQSAIARLESGNHSVSFETLSKVVHALGKEIKIV